MRYAPVLDQFGNVAGHEVPFDRTRLAALYPTHAAYVRAVIRDVTSLVVRRFLTVPDGLRLIREAARSDVP